MLALFPGRHGPDIYGVHIVTRQTLAEEDASPVPLVVLLLFSLLAGY